MVHDPIEYIRKIRQEELEKCTAALRAARGEEIEKAMLAKSYREERWQQLYELPRDLQKKYV